MFRILLMMGMHLYKKSAHVISRLADTFHLAICGIMIGTDYSRKEDWNVKSHSY